MELGDRRGPAAGHDRVGSAGQHRGPRRDVRVLDRRAGDTYECSLDGAPFTICSSPKTYTGLAVGTHTFRVQTHSPDPIVEQVPTEYTWTVVDTTAPDTTITFGPSAVTGNPDANLTFTASETGTTFECRLDEGNWEPCDSAVQYPALALGDHTFAVRAIDAAGNPDPSPATRSWRLVARPETTIDSGPDVRDRGVDRELRLLVGSAGLDLRVRA